MHTLTLAHQYLLLELDDDSGLSLTPDMHARTHGLAGAVVAELQWKGVLVPSKADQFVIRPGGHNLTGALAEAAAALGGRRPRTLKRCIKLVPSDKLRCAFLGELVSVGALSMEQERYFLVFRRTRWRALPSSPEETLVEHLRQHVQDAPHHGPPCREDLLLSILRSTKLLASVWIEVALAQHRLAIERCTQRAPIGQLVRELIKETHASMMTTPHKG